MSFGRQQPIGLLEKPPEFRWAAYDDGMGHAFLVGRSYTRALCGAPRRDERWEHPIAIRHAECTELANELLKRALRIAPETETEKRAAHGDR